MMQVSVTMKKCSSSALLLLLFISVVMSSAESNNLPPINTIKEPNRLSTCIDDSDCKDLQGGDFRCFMYVCYPWKDDKAVPESEKRNTCRKDSDCDPGQECYRHHDVRSVSRGLCFDVVVTCDTEDECPEGYNCCGNHCCEEEYFDQFATLPCVSDVGCRDLHLGEYCCPRTNSSSVCCDVDPRAPPTQSPSIGDMALGAPPRSISSAMLMLIPVGFIWNRNY